MTSGFNPYTEYKDTSLPWLKRIPSHWHLERGKWLFQRMERPVKPHYGVVTCFRDGMVTLRTNRRTTGFTESIKEIGYQGVCIGDLVIHAMDAFAGAIGVSDSDGKCSPVYTVCKPRPNVNPYFYAYIIRNMAHSGWIKAQARGIRERSTDFRYASFASQFLPMPPSQEQDAIVRYLRLFNTKVNAFIRNRRRIIEVLNEQKQAIINRAVTRGLDPDVRLKPSGVDWLGDIPEHWETTTLGRLVKTFKTGPFGSILHQSDYVQGGIPLVNPVHMTGGTITPDVNCTVGDDTYRRLKGYALEEADIVFSRRGELGRCALVHSEQAGWLIGTGSILARLVPNTINPDYLITALQGHWVANFLSLMSVGTTMQNLNTGILSRVPIPLPPLNEQRNIPKLVEKKSSLLNKAINRAQLEIKQTREYRTRLISDAVTGKLDVRQQTTDSGEDLSCIIDPYDNIKNEALLPEDEPEFVEEAGE